MRRRRRRRRRRWAHALAIHAARHFDMTKELHGFLVSISMHARGSPFCIGMGLHSAALRAPGAPLLRLYTYGVTLLSM